ncbi:MAG TPA: proline--tRNA ligase, partial [Elusimicrobia bacterium]|nr:proline--tRNA ligase [Elusimicrobiota bacterium]
TNYQLPILADYSVENIVNGISGANKKDYHLMNINLGRDYQPESIIDLRKVKSGDFCPKCSKVLAFSRGIEVGHTFKLGTKYSQAMKATFLDAQGKEQYFIMGCYGIGVSRIVAAAIEQSNDENGIIWPVNIAPYQLVVILVNSKEEKVRQISEKIYSELQKAGYEVLLDDRDERPGVKFKDTDLIGIPVRVVVSEKNLLQGKVEVKKRNESEFTLIPIDSLVSEIKNFLT